MNTVKYKTLELCSACLVQQRSTARGWALAVTFLGCAPGWACDSEEMIAQMRSACGDMVAGYQKAMTQPLAASTTASLAKARVHCQALEFDKAGMLLATALRPTVKTK